MCVKISYISVMLNVFLLRYIATHYFHNYAGSDVNYAKNYGNFSPKNYITQVAQFLRQH